MISIKIFVFVILVLSVIIHESASIKCYDCFNLIDGEQCALGGLSVRLIDCPTDTMCYSMFGKGKFCVYISIIWLIFLFNIAGIQQIVIRSCATRVCDRQKVSSLSGTCTVCNTNTCNSGGLPSLTKLDSALSRNYTF